MNQDPSDPPRLADDPSGRGRLGELVRASRSDVPTDGDLKMLEARLAPLLWPGAAAPGAVGEPSGTGAGTGTNTAVLGKVLGAVAVVAAAGGVAYWLSQEDTRPAPIERASEQPSVPPGEPEKAIPAKPPLPESTEMVEEAAEPEAPAARSVETSQPSVTRPRASAPKKALPTEAELLEAARRALDSNPQRALGLIRQHERRFPNGMLAQEREVLEIAALKKLGREQAAEQKAEDFKKEFPGSAHQRKVDGVVRER
jgi:hypothetical protein